mgnify:FL=1
MNERIKEIALQSGIKMCSCECDMPTTRQSVAFAKLIIEECANREELLGAIARGWCSEKNSHKIMDSDLALAIFDEVEQQIRHVVVGVGD